MATALSGLGCLTADQFLTAALQKRLKEVGAERYLKMKVAFPHPITGKHVFLIDDFPHAIKKVCEEGMCCLLDLTRQLPRPTYLDTHTHHLVYLVHGRSSTR